MKKHKRYTFYLEDLTHAILIEMKIDLGISMSQIVGRLIWKACNQIHHKRAYARLTKSEKEVSDEKT